VAFFGQKDAAQSAIIRRLVRDLDFPVEIVICPIVREPDELAMSSRNTYLNPEERKRARVLHRSLAFIEEKFRGGEKNASQLIATGRGLFAQEPEVRLDYFEIVDPDTLDPVERIEQPALVAVAAYIGSTRLIDNVILNPGY
jgi:pantoate--beta-alanine ligase